MDKIEEFKGHISRISCHAHVLGIGKCGDGCYKCVTDRLIKNDIEIIDAKEIKELRITNELLHEKNKDLILEKNRLLKKFPHPLSSDLRLQNKLIITENQNLKDKLEELKKEIFRLKNITDEQEKQDYQYFISYIAMGDAAKDNYGNCIVTLGNEISVESIRETEKNLKKTINEELGRKIYTFVAIQNYKLMDK